MKTTEMSALPALIEKAKLIETQIETLRAILDRIVSSGSPTTQISKQNLTGQESKILKMIQIGKSAAQIATKLNLSRRTVESHIYNMKKKNPSIFSQG